jgi:hypothetical protein
MGNYKAAFVDVSRQAEQLHLNCKWLIEKTDAIFYALCPNKIGTWQQRAEMAAQAAVELAQRSANSARDEIYANTVCPYCQHFDGEHCSVPCGLVVGEKPSSFIGRKLRPC